VDQQQYDGQQQQSHRRPTRKQVLWIVGIAAVFAVAVGYSFGITLWDWIQLLIVPAVIAAGGLWFNSEQRNREIKLAERRAQGDALEAYLDDVTELLTDKARPLHRAQMGDSLSTVARARTLAVLPRLDSISKGSVLQFLYESALIGVAVPSEKKGLQRLQPVFLLDGADLSGVEGSAQWGISLNGADLRGVILRGAVLDRDDLRYANLSGADLRGATLTAASMSGVNLPATDLSHANLSGATLDGTSLVGADLSYANLIDAKGLTNEVLKQQSPGSSPRTLKGATMPNGQKYEDWLKDEEKEEAEQAKREAAVFGALQTGDYKGLTVAEVAEKLDTLSALQLEQVREYEKQNKNRKTLIEQIDRKIRAKNS
jgi:hypothetical protein